MNEVELFVPGDLASVGMPLHEQLKCAWLLRYRNALTRSGYDRNVSQWFEWTLRNNIDPLHCRRMHVELWLRLLEQSGARPSTINNKIVAVASFYRYAVAEELIEHDPTVLVDRPPLPTESSTNGLTRVELATCLDVAREHGARAHALFCLGGLNGFRISEILGIDIEHLGFERMYPVVRIFRKGGRWETQPLGYRAHGAVTDLRGGRERAPLFVTATGKRWERQAAGRLVKKIAQQAGITKSISPHSLRHAFVTAAKNSGASERDIMAATGHRDPKTLRWYDRDQHNIARSAVHSVEAYVAGAI